LTKEESTCLSPEGGKRSEVGIGEISTQTSLCRISGDIFWNNATYMHDKNLNRKCKLSIREWYCLDITTRLELILI